MSFTAQAQDLIEWSRGTGDLYVLSAANDAEAALDGGPWEVWPYGCAHFARPTAGAYDRTKYTAFCGPWEESARAKLLELANALQAGGYTGQAEVAASLADQTVTMGEQSDVLPDRSTFEWPTWLKWAAGVIAARELLNVWSKIK